MDAPVMVRRWLVTGGNKGIGFGIVRGLLESGAHVILGSRDVSRGEAAVRSLVDEDPSLSSRVEFLQLDVLDPKSVEAAASAVAAGGPLDGLVNNAGGASGMGHDSHENAEWVVNLNYRGVVMVTDAMLPALRRSESGARIVMVSSGGAPSFVSKCSAARQAVLTDFAVTREQVDRCVNDYLGCSAAHVADVEAARAAMAEAGFDPGTYGLTKSAVNAYAMAIARENPWAKVNCCSPGFVETDLTRAFAVQMGKTPQELGLIPVEKGVICPLYLALSDEVPTPAGQSWYFGSDTLRSPLDKYRSPGDPPYTGGESSASTKSFGIGCPTVSRLTAPDP